MTANDETLQPLRSIAGADPDRRRQLADASDWTAFTTAAGQIARSAGVAFDADDLAGLRQQDPIGLGRFGPPPSPPPASPEPGWLPMQLVGGQDGVWVDWLHFGDRPLREPFFEFDVLEALGRPFNTLFRFRTPATALADWARAVPTVRPSGLIFHMSRCGSTLVTQMLAASEANVVVSEAKPLDVALQVAASGASDGEGLVRDMVAALGQARHGASRYFLKLEPWQLFCLPLFRRAFPGLPWVFLYRDPIEVLASLAGEPMAQLAPLSVLQQAIGVASPDRTGRDEARFLALVCERAAAELQAAGSDGLAVNYAELPDAVGARILPHFGVACGAEERGRMREAAAFNAKAPWQAFTPDSDAKRARAGDAVAALARAHLAEPYAALEALNPVKA